MAKIMFQNDCYKFKFLNSLPVEVKDRLLELERRESELVANGDHKGWKKAIANRRRAYTIAKKQYWDPRN